MDYKKLNDYELLYLISWHSEEALTILIKKYEVLIKTKLAKFNILSYHYADYFQELQLTLIIAIRKYTDIYGKSLCRFVELLIERRIIKLLQNDSKDIRGVYYLEEDIPSKKEDIVEKMIYEKRLQEIKDAKLDDLKKGILRDVLLGDVGIKEFAKSNNMSVKDVYNHIYLLRCKLKEKY